VSVKKRKGKGRGTESAGRGTGPAKPLFTISPSSHCKKADISMLSFAAVVSGPAAGNNVFQVLHWPSGPGVKRETGAWPSLEAVMPVLPPQR